jgi:glycosyltransferase involved in cell wall biosynthesis
LPIISVVIPTRNRYALLNRAVQSVLKQTFDDFEILVVDDASSDNTHSVIEKIKDGRINYILLEDKSGGSKARNIGIENSKGKYIAFLDDDDEWLPEKLIKQIERFQKDDKIGICYTGRQTMRKEKITGLSKRYSFKYPPYDDHTRSIMSDNFIGITSSVIIPRTILIEVGGFDEKLPCLQDYDLFIRILKKWKADGINEPLVRYYLGSTTGHVSFTRENVEFASKYITEKYKNEEFIHLLKKAIRKINRKKILKSFGYAKDVIQYSLNGKRKK